MLKHGILGLLSYDDMSGYQIMETFRDSLNYFWQANTSQIYRELQTLKKNGFVNDTVIKQESRPDKKIFSITESGKEELKKWLRNDDMGNTNNGICMKTFFSSKLSTQENLERFKQMKIEYSNVLKQYDGIETIADLYGKNMQNKDSVMYWKMTISYGKKYVSMHIDWLNECIQQLEACL